MLLCRERSYSCCCVYVIVVVVSGVVLFILLCLRLQLKGPVLEKKCLYVQQCMGTKIALLADADLHKHHDVLNSLVSF